MGKVIPFMQTRYTLEKRISRECDKANKAILDHASWLYKWTAGFQDPDPPTEEEIEGMNDGYWER